MYCIKCGKDVSFDRGNVCVDCWNISSRSAYLSEVEQNSEDLDEELRDIDCFDDPRKIVNCTKCNQVLTMQERHNSKLDGYLMCDRCARIALFYMLNPKAHI